MAENLAESWQKAKNLADSWDSITLIQTLYKRVGISWVEVQNLRAGKTFI